MMREPEPACVKNIFYYALFVMALAIFRLLFSCVFYNFDPGKCSTLEKPDGGSLQLDDKGAKGEKVTLTCEKNYVPSQNFSS